MPMARTPGGGPRLVFPTGNVVGIRASQPTQQSLQSAGRVASGWLPSARA